MNKRIFILLLSLLWITNNAVKAQTPTQINMSSVGGDVTIKSDGWYVGSTKKAGANAAGYEFSGTTTQYNITVNLGVTTTLYFNNLVMNMAKTCINVSGSNTTVVLRNGTNNRIIKTDGTEYYPGTTNRIYESAFEKHGKTGKLTLTCESEHNGVAGHKCNASCGHMEVNASAYNHAPALGAASLLGRGGLARNGTFSGVNGEYAFSNLYIKGGDYYFQGGQHGPGIGVGCVTGFVSNNKSITDGIYISGGIVEAHASVCGAGIGGGHTSAAKNIYISNGAIVKAYGNGYSPGIGSGGTEDLNFSKAPANLDCENIVITGGSTIVTAYGDAATNTPGIGCGIDAGYGNSAYPGAIRGTVHNVKATPLKVTDGADQDYQGYVKYGTSATNYSYSTANPQTPFGTSQEFGTYLQNEAAAGRPVYYTQVYFGKYHNNNDIDRNAEMGSMNDTIPTGGAALTAAQVLAICSPEGHDENGNPIVFTAANINASQLAALNTAKTTWQTGSFPFTFTYTYTAMGGGNLSITSHIVLTKTIPDNIRTDVTCNGTPPASEWLIKEVDDRSVKGYFSEQTVRVGDIDGDGEIEILATGFTPTHVKRIDILRSDLSIKKSINMPSNRELYFESLSAIARVKYDATHDTTMLFVIPYYVESNDDYNFYAYDIDGHQLWKSSQPTDASWYKLWAGAIWVADLDGDGWQELVVGNSVFAAENGKRLWTIDPTDNYPNRGGIASWYQPNDYMQVAVGDVLGNGKQQVCIGNKVYDFTITSRNEGGATATVAKELTALPAGVTTTDGATQIADFDLDSYLDIVVSNVNRTDTYTGGPLNYYIWSPHKGEILASYTQSNVYKRSVPLIGDIDGDNYPEIVFMHGRNIGDDYSAQTDSLVALKYNPSSPTKTLSVFWRHEHEDKSGSTGMTLFDFNQDNISEIVYRDEQNLRIINGSLKSHRTGNDTTEIYDMAKIECHANTCFEYPVIADVDNDGQAEIIVVGNEVGNNTAAGDFDHNRVRIFKSGSNSATWAPARKVWNQFAYNAVCVNEDLTIPKYPLSPAAKFAGSDGIYGNADDVRPYNNFLQQQTTLSANGTPLWALPNATSIKDSVMTYDPLTDVLVVTAKIKNNGNRGLAPFNVTIYKDSIAIENILANDSIPGGLNEGAEGAVTVTVPNASLHFPFGRIILRANDKNGVFPYMDECRTYDNEKIDFTYNSDVTKSSRIVGDALGWNNGKLGNPISVLGNETIEYKIECKNTGTGILTDVQFTDIFPGYLNAASPTVAAGTVDGRSIVQHTEPTLAPGATKSISFFATPESGVCASQPLFINEQAFVIIDGKIYFTNQTFHQGAGIAIVTFSAAAHGEIYNAEPQAVDFMSAVESGVLIVPDEGYEFAGWSHKSYSSMRDSIIPAESGIMNLDTLTIYGNVELTAVFVREGTVGNETVAAETQNFASLQQNKIWSTDNTLWVKAANSGSIISIYNTAGILIRQLTAVGDGTTEVKLSQGVYIVSVNGEPGKKVRIN